MATRHLFFLEGGDWERVEESGKHAVPTEQIPQRHWKPHAAREEPGRAPAAWCACTHMCTQTQPCMHDHALLLWQCLAKSSVQVWGESPLPSSSSPPFLPSCTLQQGFQAIQSKTTMRLCLCCTVELICVGQIGHPTPEQGVSQQFLLCVWTSPASTKQLSGQDADGATPPYAQCQQALPTNCTKLLTKFFPEWQNERKFSFSVNLCRVVRSSGVQKDIIFNQSCPMEWWKLIIYPQKPSLYHSYFISLCISATFGSILSCFSFHTLRPLN